jgi:hypothetical protein
LKDSGKAQDEKPMSGLPNRAIRELCGLRSMEHAAADLGKFRNERGGIPASHGRGVYLGGQQDGGCQVRAARETKLLGPSWEFEELRNTATHATVTNQILINTF